MSRGSLFLPLCQTKARHVVCSDDTPKGFCQLTQDWLVRIQVCSKSWKESHKMGGKGGIKTQEAVPSGECRGQTTHVGKKGKKRKKIVAGDLVHSFLVLLTHNICKIAKSSRKEYNNHSWECTQVSSGLMSSTY